MHVTPSSQRLRIDVPLSSSFDVFRFSIYSIPYRDMIKIKTK